jgi:hypothetical protein
MALTYDWSSFPTSELEGSVVRWQEQLAPDDTPERTTVGINYTRQTRDANLNFLAGALVGVAGAAILSAIQETLHISD